MKRHGTQARPAYLPPKPTGESHLSFWQDKLSDPSFVYVVQAQGDTPIKVGVAKNVHARMRAIQTYNPRKIRLLYVIPGSYALEAEFHRKLRHSRMHGEWFDGPDVPGFLHEVQVAAQRMVDEHRDSEPIPTPEPKADESMRVRFVEPTPVSPDEVEARLKKAWRQKRPRDESTIT